MTSRFVPFAATAPAALLAAALLAAVPAGAQPLEATVSREEQAALTALEVAAASTNRAAQDAALASARASARTAPARFAMGQLQYRIGLQRADQQLSGQGAELILQSGLARPEQIGPLLAFQAARALNSGDMGEADRVLTRINAMEPANPALLADHAHLKSRLGDRPAAVALFQRAIAAAAASGRPGPESWYRRALALAVEAQAPAAAGSIGRALVEAYPTPVNWRDAVISWRGLNAADGSHDLDVTRLLRAAGGLAGERDYLEFATALNQAGLAGEAKAVLDEGVSRGMLDTAKATVSSLVTAVNRRATQERPTLARLRTQAGSAANGAPARTAADAHFGHGQYAEAAELYAAALAKGGEDPNLVNLRLGAALALAGRRAEAEAALRAVSGPRVDLAGFWLAWLARRPA